MIYEPCANSRLISFVTAATFDCTLGYLRMLASDDFNSNDTPGVFLPLKPSIRRPPARLTVCRISEDMRQERHRLGARLQEERVVQM